MIGYITWSGIYWSKLSMDIEYICIPFGWQYSDEYTIQCSM
jgi:hypothetical protein